MEQIYFQSTAQNSNQKGIADASSGKNNSILKSKPSGINALITPPIGGAGGRLLVSRGGSNIFMIQNKGKGPPGRKRSPGVASFPEHPPDVQTNPVRVQKPDTIDEQLNQHINTNRTFSQRSLSLAKGNTLHTEQTLNNILKLNFLQTLNFTNMKKQILFLAFFILVLITGSTSVFGQALKWSDPRPFTCDDDALHPIAGVRYTYEADVTDPTGTGKWRFWATKDKDFITTDAGGAQVFNFGAATALDVSTGKLNYASTDYNIDITLPAANTDGIIELEWSSTILNGTDYQGIPGPGTPTFVVAYYQNADGCTDNIKVWELDPLNGFVVDVIAMDPAGFAASKDAYDPTDAPETCVDRVESATYVAGGTMAYDYGDNYLYFEFIAANFTDHWVPTFELTGISGSQVVTSYEYTFSTPDTWATAPTWTTLASGTTQIAPASTITDISKGVSIFVRVRVDHNQWELIADETLTMTLDGQNADGVWDVHNDDCTELDPPAQDSYDTATTVITQRPEIPEATPTVSPITPNVDIIPGNNE